MTAAQFKAKPKRAKRRDVEGPIQREIIAYLHAVMPHAMVHHPAAESHLSGKAAMLATVRKKRDGMVTGFPDLIVLPYAAKVGAIFFEVKSPKGKTTEEQDVVHNHLRGLGYRVAVVRSVSDVREFLKQWGVGFVEKIPHRGQING